MAQLLTLAVLGAEEVSAVVAGGGSSVAAVVSLALMAAGICQVGAAGVVLVARAAVVLLIALRNDEGKGNIQNYSPKIVYKIAYFCEKNFKVKQDSI